MTNTKHTPAPWQVIRLKNMQPHLVGGDHCRIALLDDCHLDDVAEANARLIKSAPELADITQLKEYINTAQALLDELK